MNSPLLTTEGVILFIATPSVLLSIGLLYMLMFDCWRGFIFSLVSALVLLVIGFGFGGENTVYRYPAQKINDQNFSLFYSNDLYYRVITDSKQWNNKQGDILVTKRHNAWGEKISESVMVVPTVKQNK